ncbi:MAG: DUF4013 domain-containing protein [Dehalococcoidia bacterium]|nr:DUF4013 domain-containing protein [Dehalococcoidia bacterium]
MEFGKAYSYVFEDPQWVNKLLFAALFVLLSFALIGIPFLLGYTVLVIRNVYRGDPNPLPEWTDFGNLFSEGLKLVVVVLGWLLPGILLSCLGNVLQTIAATQTTPRGETTAVAAALGFVALAVSCVQFLYSIFNTVITPSYIVKYAQTGNIAACFRVGELFSFITRNPGMYAIVVILGFVNGIISGVGLIALCVGVFFTAAYANFVNAHLYGQLWQSNEPAPYATYAPA